KRQKTHGWMREAPPWFRENPTLSSGVSIEEFGYMRLITRADLDGLTSAILLQEVEPIDEVDFAHPKDVQDGKVDVTGNDILANLPYDERAALWFDHHASQADAAWNPNMKGNFEIAPSAARVIADHYKSDKFTRFHDLLDATDRLDAALLTRDDIVNPQGWI